MAKRKIILPVAMIAVILLAAVIFAACAPSSYSVMSPALQDYYNEYGEYYNNIVKSGRVRYRDAETGLYGYLDSNGNVAIEAKYTSARAFGDGFAVVALDGNYALIDKDGAVIDGYFDGASATPAAAIVRKDGKYGVYNKKGCVLPVVYDSIEANYSTYIIERGGKYGLADLSGKILIQPQYDMAESFADLIGGGMDCNAMSAFVDMTENKYVFADGNGNIMLTSYTEGFFLYVGNDMYMGGNAAGRACLYEDDLSTIVCKLPENAVPASYSMLDEERILLTDEDTGNSFIYNIGTGERTAVQIRRYTSGSGAIYPAVKDGDAFSVYNGGKIVLTLGNEEADSVKIVSGTFRDYAYNTVTNTLTDLLTGEQLTLPREIADVTAAEEGMFVVKNAAGKLAVCAKNGDMLSPFCYNSVSVMADGFIGLRTVNGESVYEWRGFDGNLILRTSKMQIFAN